VIKEAVRTPLGGSLGDENDQGVKEEAKENMRLIGSDDFKNDRLHQARTTDLSNTCPICLDQKLEVVMPCMHSFCSKCITHWTHKNQSCPLCRFVAASNGKNEPVDQEFF